jgi:hypothetical protein
MWVGICIRNRTRAFLTTLGVLLFWIPLPDIINNYIYTGNNFIYIGDPVPHYLSTLSPAGLIRLSGGASFAIMAGAEPECDLTGNKPDYSRFQFSNSTSKAYVFAGAAIAIGIQLAMIAFFRNAALRAADKKLRQ